MKNLSIFLLTTFLVFLSGCGTIAIKKNELIIDQPSIAEKNSKYFNKISKVRWYINIYNGIKVDPYKFKQSVMADPIAAKNRIIMTQSFLDGLKKAQVFNSNGNIEVVILEIHEKLPGFGIDMKSSTKIKYQLKELNGKILQEDVVEAEYSATLADSVIGVERSRIALAGAWETNFKQYIEKIVYVY